MDYQKSLEDQQSACDIAQESQEMKPQGTRAVKFERDYRKRKSSVLIVNSSPEDLGEAGGNEIEYYSFYFILILN